MKSGKKQNIIIGIIISVLLSIFVNYSLFAMNLEIILSGNAVEPTTINDNTLIIFSLVWFVFVAFLFYVITMKIIEMGIRRWKKEYKAILLAGVIDLVIVFFLIQLYAIVEEQLSDRQATFAIIEGYNGEMIFSEVGPDSIISVFSGTESENSMYADSHSSSEFTSTISDTMFTRPVMTEHIFVLVTIFMFVILVRIIDSRKEMALKIEKLQKENLQSSYNALMGQINPHFFFNSLGGLNSLIRSGEQERTLIYLEELTSVFRYILQSNHKEIVSLSDELDFVKAYTYLLSIRYEGKFSFSMDIDSKYLSYKLPVLSLLPLIENAIKHNIVSKSCPLQINIYIHNENVVVSNSVQSKEENKECTGIGLKNLSGRYMLLTDRDIIVNRNHETFEVKLPLIKT